MSVWGDELTGCALSSIGQQLVRNEMRSCCKQVLREVATFWRPVSNWLGSRVALQVSLLHASPRVGEAHARKHGNGSNIVS
jgi:hypothetical protein